MHIGHLTSMWTVQVLLTWYSVKLYSDIFSVSLNVDYMLRLGLECTILSPFIIIALLPQKISQFGALKT